MTDRLLHVLKAAPATIAEADAVLRAMRRACPRSSDRRTLLLFCDLPSSDTADDPQDAALIRRLQSGVMSAQARKPDSFHLLVRRRSWNDAEHLYLGQTQTPSAEQVICDLMLKGHTDASFLAATCAPASLRGRYHAVLFSDIAHICTPDTPLYMLEALEHADSGCVGCRLIPYAPYPQTVLHRLAKSGFSLSSFHEAREMRLRKDHLTCENTPRMYAADRLQACLSTYAHTCPACESCIFVSLRAPSARDLFAAHHRRALSIKDRAALLPLFQFPLLFVFASLGLSAPTILLFLLTEYHALIHPVRLPGALLRLALLPVTAMVTLNACLQKRFAQNRRFSVALSDPLMSPVTASFSGVIIILAALAGMQALHVFLPIGLLWLFCPMILSALSLPTAERIPISPDDQKQLRALADDAFFCSESAPTDSPLSLDILAACAAAMLGLLEPDEAARRAEKSLDLLKHHGSPVDRAQDQAGLLAAAQYLREQMDKCDAALRPLPAMLESFVLSQPAPREHSRLGVFLCAARNETSPACASSAPADDAALDLLFLPIGSAAQAAMHDVTLPLTHPHTFLRRHLAGQTTESSDPTAAFLALTAAALSHPFYALLQRSPITAPYWPLLCI